VKRENWAYQDLPAILVLRERKETRARKARMDTRERREIGYVTASLFERSAVVCELEIPNRTTITVKPRFTKASDHEQFCLRTSFPNTKRLG